VVIRIGYREKLLVENIACIEKGTKVRGKQPTYEVVMSSEEIHRSLYFSCICGANSRYKPLSEILFYFVCAYETRFSDVLLWVLQSQKRYPQQSLVSLYSSRYGLIYPHPTPHTSRPFFRVTQPDGQTHYKPFVMFRKREDIVLHALRELAQVEALAVREVPEGGVEYIALNEAEGEGEVEESEGKPRRMFCAYHEKGEEEEDEEWEDESACSSEDETDQNYQPKTPTRNTAPRRTKQPALDDVTTRVSSEKTRDVKSPSRKTRDIKSPSRKTRDIKSPNKNSPSRARKKDEDPDFEVDSVIEKFRKFGSQKQEIT